MVTSTPPEGATHRVRPASSVWLRSLRRVRIAPFGPGWPWRSCRVGPGLRRVGGVSVGC